MDYANKQKRRFMVNEKNEQKQQAIAYGFCIVVMGYILLRFNFGVNYYLMLLGMVTLFSTAAFIYLKTSWRTFYRVSDEFNKLVDSGVEKVKELFRTLKSMKGGSK